MSTMETILTRMMKDSAFADAVFADAEKALTEYDLPVEDVAKFKTMPRTNLGEFVSASPEERKSMSLSLNFTKVEINHTGMDAK